MADNVFLILLESSGNQNYIFGTNKLRENIGASEAVYLAGTRLVATALNAVFNVGCPFEPAKIDKWINDQEKNPPIEADTGQGVEVIIATSGKALLLTSDKEKAAKFITEWSRLVRRMMPGVDATGVFSSEFSMKDSNRMAITSAIKEVHKKFEEARTIRTSPEARFQRLPIIAPCDTSSLPAEAIYEWPSGTEHLGSRSTIVKHQYAESAWNRIVDLYKEVEVLGDKLSWDDEPTDPGKVAFPRSYKIFEKNWKPSWTAVLHADGNGLGRIFMNFENYLPDPKGKLPSRHYIDYYRGMSKELNDTTLRAFHEALSDKVFAPSEEKNDKKQYYEVPVLPLILGGDDLSAILLGEHAIHFAKLFLDAFEHHAGKITKEIAKKAHCAGRLSMCAGISIVKPHFPFHVAYNLAESLLKSAKDVKKRIRLEDQDVPFPCSAMDWHIVYDSSVTSLDDIRARLEVDDGEALLFTKPYVTSSKAALYETDPKADTGEDWFNNHSFDMFNEVFTAIDKRGDQDESRVLPNSKSYEMREALFLGREFANKEFNLITQRYRFKYPHDELFVQEDNKKRTHFLDALEALEFYNPPK